MLTTSKKTKLQNAVKAYSKKYLHGKVTELDESGTRLMINTFLTDVLGFIPIDEIKTEYMIRGTYADYVIQTKGVRHFLVEVKALSFALSDKHLRQAINYGANEGIEWALLTNGKCFEFYKILFNKPIESRKIFSFDLSDSAQIKHCAEAFQYIHKESIASNGLTQLWNKTSALDPLNVAGLLFAPAVTNFIKRTLKNKFKSKFTDEEIQTSIYRIINEPIPLENIKPIKIKKAQKKSSKEKSSEPTSPIIDPQIIEEISERISEENS